MRITLADGTSREVSIRDGYTGPKAEAVTLTKADVDAFRRLANSAPVLFNIRMRELASRFVQGGDVMEVRNG